MTDIEVLLTDIGEVTKNTRKDIEEKLGETVISKENSLNYQYINNNELLEENKNIDN